jgi:hypothetical protein
VTGHRTVAVPAGQSSAMLPSSSADVKIGSCTVGQPYSYATLSKILFQNVKEK